MINRTLETLITIADENSLDFPLCCNVVDERRVSVPKVIKRLINGDGRSPYEDLKDYSVMKEVVSRIMKRSDSSDVAVLLNGDLMRILLPVFSHYSLENSRFITEKEIRNLMGNLNVHYVEDLSERTRRKSGKHYFVVGNNSYLVGCEKEAIFKFSPGELYVHLKERFEEMWNESS